MTGLALTDVTDWRKSSHSAYNGSCVEAASSLSMVAVRDSADRCGAVLVFSGSAWTAFTGELKRQDWQPCRG